MTLTSATGTTDSGPTYVLGDSAEEQRRLIRQAEILAPATRQVFQEAGIAPGMRVLDVGSGVGDVSLLVADLVGPDGSVVGVDRSEPHLATARRRAAAAGHGQVRFVAGDLAELDAHPDLGDGFDAAVGRVVLKFLPEPGAVLRSIARRVRPGGVVAVQEGDISLYCHSVPATPPMTQVREWLLASFLASGIDVHFGFKLPQLFAAAGLPRPQLRFDTNLGSGPDFEGYRQAADVVRSVLPSLEAAGIATAEEVDVDTLADRLRDAAVEAGATTSILSVVGAWARVPGQDDTRPSRR